MLAIIGVTYSGPARARAISVYEVVMGAAAARDGIDPHRAAAAEAGAQVPSSGRPRNQGFHGDRNPLAATSVTGGSMGAVVAHARERLADPAALTALIRRPRVRLDRSGSDEALCGLAQTDVWTGSTWNGNCRRRDRTTPARPSTLRKRTASSATSSPPAPIKWSDNTTPCRPSNRGQDSSGVDTPQTPHSPETSSPTAGTGIDAA